MLTVTYRPWIDREARLVSIGSVRIDRYLPSGFTGFALVGADDNLHRCGPDHSRDSGRVQALLEPGRIIQVFDLDLNTSIRLGLNRIRARSVTSRTGEDRDSGNHGRQTRAGGSEPSVASGSGWPGPRSRVFRRYLSQLAQEPVLEVVFVCHFMPPSIEFVRVVPRPRGFGAGSGVLDAALPSR